MNESKEGGRDEGISHFSSKGLTLINGRRQRRQLHGLRETRRRRRGIGGGGRDIGGGGGGGGG